MQQFDTFAQMQRDAERRVMEMQRRATAAVASSSQESPQDGGFDNEPPFSAPPSSSPPPSDNPLSALGLNDEDGERLLLIAVLLLVREHADQRLLFLLLYLLN